MGRKILIALVACVCALAAGATVTTAAHAGGYQVTSVWGEAGFEPGQLANPKGVAVASDGSVWVVDYVNDTLVKYDAEGRLVIVVGGEGSARGRFVQPSRLAIGPDDSVYVTDAGNDRIQRFSQSGAVLGVWGATGSGPGQFRHPRGIDVAPNGEVYVTDETNHRVEVFSATGVFLRLWGRRGTGPGQFDRPKDVAVGVDGRVYVVDADSHRVQVFSELGTWLGVWGKKGQAPGRFWGPRGICAGLDGHVFVADAVNCRIQEFTGEGSFVRQWGSRGTLAGQFLDPRDLALAPDGSLVVVDTHNHRLQRFVLNAAADVTPPVTLCDRPPGWVHEPIQVTLAATDDSGVAATYYGAGRSDFAPVTGPLALVAQGTYVVRYLSTDAVGNQEATHTSVFLLDWSPPVVSPRRPHVVRVPAGARLTVYPTVADRLSPDCLVRVQVLRGESLVWARGRGWRSVSPAGLAVPVLVSVPSAPDRYTLRLILRDRAGNRCVQDRSLLALPPR